MKIIASMKKFVNLKFLKSTLLLNVIFIIGCFMVGSKVLFYSSFEKNDKPSFNQWIVSDTGFVKLMEDVPQKGDKYSLYIEGHWGPPAVVKTAVPSIQGVHNYRLTLMGKKDKLNGTAWFGINKDSVFKSNSLQITSESWKKYSMERLLILDRQEGLLRAFQESHILTKGNMASLSTLILPLYFFVWAIDRFSGYTLAGIQDADVNILLICLGMGLDIINHFFILPLTYAALVLAYLYLKD